MESGFGSGKAIRTSCRRGVARSRVAAHRSLERSASHPQPYAKRVAVECMATRDNVTLPLSIVNMPQPRPTADATKAHTPFLRVACPERSRGGVGELANRGKGKIGHLKVL